MKEWFEKLDRTKQLVIKYLRTFPHTRDNDKELFFMILSDYYRAIPKAQRTDDEDRLLSDLYILMLIILPHYFIHHKFNKIKKIQNLQVHRIRGRLYLANLFYGRLSIISGNKLIY